MSAFDGLPIRQFMDARGEELLVKAYLAKTKTLSEAIADGRLRRVSEITLPPDSQQLLFVYFRPDPVARANVQGRTRKVEEKLYVRLKEFDREIASEHMGPAWFTPPVRELPVCLCVCFIVARSVLVACVYVCVSFCALSLSMSCVCACVC